jgi:transposase InsO family protein
LLHAVALARAALVEIYSGFENSPTERLRQAAKIERLSGRVRLLEEMMRIKDRRMALIPPGERPHYVPEDRLAILTLRAAEGWSTAETAREFLLTAQTVASWTRRLDEDGPAALVRTPAPVNRFPDFVALLFQKLRTALPSMGKVRIAQVLARAGLVLSASTVKRLAERRLALPEPPRPRAAVGQDETALPRAALKAKHVHHVWHVDLTVVPTGLGFWIPWFPFSFAVSWPFCFWIGVVLDHFSRSVVARRAFLKEPSAVEVCALLDSAVESAGRVSTHIVSDQGPQFREAYCAWCARHGTKPRFGSFRAHGSIAIIERFWRSMKEECFRRLSVVPFALAAFEAELDAYCVWYVEHRPHAALAGSTPADVRHGLTPASQLPTLEPRPRFPLVPRAGPGRFRRRLRGRLELSVSHFRRRRHLPIVELRRAA